MREKKRSVDWHRILWSLVKKLPTDFEPWGKRDRNADCASDCSCGCRFFIKMESKLGSDWGVCANPKSPRRGLLTFDHMGCKKFR